MAEVIKLVKTYRVTKSPVERLRLAEEIIRHIRPDLRLFVFSAIEPQAAEDVLQMTLNAIAAGMTNFKGDSNEVFWAWCYRIASNKLNDLYREKKSAERTHSLPPEELEQLKGTIAENPSLTAADRHDLEYAMKLLTSAKPECAEYLWRHFVFGLDYAEIAEEQNTSYDNARMRIKRCLDEAKSLFS